MGYILPVQPMQGQLYANRLALEPYNFAYIDRVNRLEKNSDFLDSFKESQEEAQLFDENEERMEKPEGSNVKPPPAYKGSIYPNPVNLSPIIAQVVGKGIAVNEYV